jgi:hypothetical protein
MGNIDMTDDRPRSPKTNEAIRAAVLSWWWSPSQTSARARDAEAWASFPKALTYEDSLRPSTVVNYAQPKGYRTTVGRVCVAARSWGEAGLDCGDGLVARFRWTHGEWRIVVSGPLGVV